MQVNFHVVLLVCMFTGPKKGKFLSIFAGICDSSREKVALQPRLLQWPLKTTLAYSGLPCKIVSCGVRTGILANHGCILG